MPTEFTIDSQRRLVISRGTGVFTQADYLDHMVRLRIDPLFNPDFDQIIDCRAFAKMDLTPSQVAELAERTIFNDRTRRAFVVSSELHFGLSRVFAAYREMKGGQQVRVFRDLNAAYAWLGIAPDKDEPNAGNAGSETRKE